MNKTCSNLYTKDKFDEIDAVDNLKKNTKLSMSTKELEATAYIKETGWTANQPSDLL